MTMSACDAGLPAALRSKIFFEAKRICLIHPAVESDDRLLLRGRRPSLPSHCVRPDSTPIELGGRLFDLFR